MLFVMLPAAHRALVEGLADLPKAGGLYCGLGSVEFEAGWIPWQAEKFNQPPALPLQVSDQLLVLDLQHPQRQGVAPMICNAVPGQVLMPASGQIEGKKVAFAKPLKKAGQAGIARIAAAENYSRRRKEQFDQAKPMKVVRHLVDDPQGLWIHGL